MKKSLCLVLWFSLAIFPTSVFAQIAAGPEPETKEIKAPAINVSVYRGKALIERNADILLDKGDNILTISGLPVTLVPGSLLVYKKDSAPFIIKEFEIINTVSSNILKDSEKQLSTDINTLQDSIQAKLDTLSVLDKKIKFLNDLTAKISDKTSQTIASTDVSVKNVDSTLLYVSDNLSKFLIDKRAAEKQLKTMQDSLAIAQSKISDLRRKTVKYERVLFVRLFSNSAVKSAIGIKYIVPNAGWNPFYEADLNFDKGEVAFKYGAALSQTSGEDWSGIKLSVSTGSPLFDVTLPVPSPWIVKEYKPQPYYNTPAMKSAAPSAAPAPMLFQQDSRTEAEIPQQVENIETGELGLNITISGKYDIPGTGVLKKVPVIEKNIKVSNMFYTVVPSKSELACLTAEFVNEGDLAILPGEVTLYLNGNYSAKAGIFNNINAGESVKFSFGVDEAVKVSKEVLQEKKGNEGFLDNSVHLNYGYKIKAANFKQKAVTIFIQEPLPFSENDKIKIELTDSTIKPFEIKDRGIYIWKIQLAPGEKTEFTYRFKVTYPKDMNVQGF